MRVFAGYRAQLPDVWGIPKCWLADPDLLVFDFPVFLGRGGLGINPDRLP
jgi:hypothetical protein